ncbi:166_t:CDS:2 [Ambispora leptoticha]|uniref:166_t:CDS:1 n=1 Tax=Ambispora leptoticha TaxID=144679 RepID=A0A9N9CIX4_9GLOM|nr:166_t:CDS:2 [Ambispora leptoticha]
MDLQKTLECDFSTSTTAEKTASRVILLDALKQYFNYGIRIRCDFWLDRLEPVIWKLVATYRGEIDEEFWSKHDNQWCNGWESFDTQLDLDLNFSAGFLGARQELVGSGDDAEV